MMSISPRTPVLVGAGAVQQRLDDPQRALEPVELMIAALRRAADDAGSADLLSGADSIRLPRGFWDYGDPGRMIADRFGAASARTQVAELGILQTTLFGLAAQAIAAGEEDVVLIAGGEAKYRAARALYAGAAAPLTADARRPDSVLRPARDMWNKAEADFGLLMPVNQYSIMENALRYAEGLSIDAHRREVAELWAAFNRAAVDNPDAWSREPLTAADIAGTGGGNRMLAFPYTKAHNSQWNVDQAAGLILCSAEAARAAGVPEDKWVFPLAVTESNHMVPLSERRRMHRSDGFRIAGSRALEIAGLAIDAVKHFELYSCFPVAVRIQAREMNVPRGRPLTLTGGMPFAGGPLNNFVLQAAVRMAEILRADRASTAMLTAVSGMLTKQGVSLWSAQPPAAACRFADVTDEVAAAMETVEVVGDHNGPATVASYTVLYNGDSPARAVAVCDLPDGRRTLAAAEDRELAAAMTAAEFCGRRVQLTGDRFALD
jgi:acetyl-CoA C-acetyltransferase